MSAIAGDAAKLRFAPQQLKGLAPAGRLDIDSTGLLVLTQDGRIAKQLIVTINAEHENARITEIQRMSRPGRRMYASVEDIPTVKRGRGMVIISTSKGLMTGDEAKKVKIGGELICKVY